MYHNWNTFRAPESLKKERDMKGKNFFESESSHELNVNIHTYTDIIYTHTGRLALPPTQ